LGAAFLCYLDRELGGVALDASATEGELAADLSAFFSEVHVLREDRFALELVRAHAARTGDSPYLETQASILEAPWTDRTFDCIAVHDALAEWNPETRETAASLERIRCLLKPEGWFMGASPNASYLRYRRAGRRGIAPRSYTRLLVDAGFREVRRIFVSPSLEAPASLIPDEPEAVAAYEILDSARGTSRWTRRVLARLGGRVMLYPTYLIMARK
jgi:hypothetical protein